MKSSFKENKELIAEILDQLADIDFEKFKKHARWFINLCAIQENKESQKVGLDNDR